MRKIVHLGERAGVCASVFITLTFVGFIVRVLAMADIHRNQDVHRHVPPLAVEYHADVLVLVGDLRGALGDNCATIDDTQPASTRDILNLLTPLMIPVLYIMGNDGSVELTPAGSHVQSIHGRRLDPRDLVFVSGTSPHDLVTHTVVEGRLYQG